MSTDKDDDALLEAKLLEGLASKSIPLDDAFHSQLQTKTEAIIEENRRRRIFRTEDLTAAQLELIANSEMDPRHNHLNAVMESPDSITDENRK